MRGIATPLAAFSYGFERRDRLDIIPVAINRQFRSGVAYMLYTAFTSIDAQDVVEPKPLAHLLWGFLTQPSLLQVDLIESFVAHLEEAASPVLEATHRRPDSPGLVDCNAVETPDRSLLMVSGSGQAATPILFLDRSL